MGAVLTRISSSMSMTSSRASRDHSSDYTSVISQPINAPVSDQVIEATERGMMGENLLFAGNWPLGDSQDDLQPTSDEKEIREGGQGLDGRIRGKSGEAFVVGWRAWDGSGGDGNRHVRWKGTDA